MKFIATLVLSILMSGVVFSQETQKIEAFNLQESCESGTLSSCSLLGRMYLTGRDVEQDLLKSAELFQKGCDGDDGKGCAELGALYSKGLGVKQDFAKAAELYKKACDKQEPVGCNNLGGLVL